MLIDPYGESVIVYPIALCGALENAPYGFKTNTLKYMNKRAKGKAYE